MGTSAPFSRDFLRAVVLGIRPQGQTHLEDAFTLLRSLVFRALIGHRHAVWVAGATAGFELTDLWASAGRIYARVRWSFQAAVAGELRRLAQLERYSRARGLPVNPVPRRERVDGLLGHSRGLQD